MSTPRSEFGGQGLSDPALGQRLDQMLDANRELDQAEAAKALQAVFDDAVRRYLNRVVPTEPRR